MFLSLDEASRLLAGLEVALSQALLQAPAARCLKCGFIDYPRNVADGSKPSEVVHCAKCGGILAPVKP